MPDVSIIIVNWNTSELLRDCLQSIEQTAGGLDLEILVVDNASADDSRGMVRRAFPGVHLIENSGNVGFAKANNQGFEEASGRYLLLLNSDTIVQPNAVAALRSFMDDHPNAGAVGARLLNPDGTMQRSCWRGFPSLRTAVIDAFYLERIGRRLPFVRASEVSDEELLDVVEVDHLLGACMMVRREVVDRVGAMDERFFLFLEETEWCHRMRRAGWGIYVVPAARVVHLGQRSVHQEPERTLPERYRSFVNFYRRDRRPSAWQILLLKIVIACGGLIRIALWTWRGWQPGEKRQARRMRSGYWAAITRVPSL